MRHDALMALLHGQSPGPPTDAPDEVAGAAAGAAVRDCMALEAEHAADHPEVVGARARLDRAVEVWREAKDNPPTVDFEGGARPMPPPGPPSHEATLLALLQVEGERVDALARDFDLDRTRGGF